MNVAGVEWELWETFAAVMRGGSLSAAARELDVAQPTVRRRIEALEEALEVVLFTRVPGGLEPTDVARASLPHAESMAASARAAARAASAPVAAGQGIVRVTASEVVGAEVLPPIVAGIVHEHPGLEIELALSNRNEDLLRRDADVAVRMVAPAQAALVVRKAAVIEIGLFAHASYLERHPAPTTLDALASDHVLVGPDRDRAALQAFEAQGLRLTPRAFRWRSDSDLAQLAAVRAGVGIGVCQLPLASTDAGLVRVLPQVRFTLPAWVAMHEDLRNVRRVRIVFDALVKGLGEYVASCRPSPSRRREKSRR